MSSAAVGPSRTHRSPGRRPDKTHSNNALGSDKLHKLVGDGALGAAFGVGLDVSEIANVAIVILGSAVLLVEGVD